MKWWEEWTPKFSKKREGDRRSSGQRPQEMPDARRDKDPQEMPDTCLPYERNDQCLPCFHGDSKA